MPYVYSTSSANVDYVNYQLRAHDVPLEIARVTIKGGAGVAHEKHFDTPFGAVTKVTDEQLELLEKNPVFQQHKAAGFIKIDSLEQNIEKATKDMTAKDLGAQLTDEDIERIATKSGAKLERVAA